MVGPADADDEVFELVNEDDEVVGTALRAQCHAEGLLHRAAYCWVTDTQGRILLQQRSHAKRMGPGQWDLSVAEHLQPGEGYRLGVVRGLAEELGISCSASELEGPLAPTHLRELCMPSFHDRELVQSYLLRGWSGETLRLDPAEVAATRWVGVEDLRAEVAGRPEDFTPWIRAEGHSLDWLRPQLQLAVLQTSQTGHDLPA